MIGNRLGHSLSPPLAQPASVTMHEMRGGGWRGHPSFRLCFTSPRGRGPRTEAFSRAGIPCQFTPSRFSGRGSAAVKTDHPERPRGTNAIPFHSNTRGSLYSRGTSRVLEKTSVLSRFARSGITCHESLYPWRTHQVRVSRHRFLPILPAVKAVLY